MQQYKSLLQTVTKKNYNPILQNALCTSEGILVSDKKIFLNIKTDVFTEAKIRDFNGVELDMNTSDFIAMPDFGAYQGLIQTTTKELIRILKTSDTYIEKGKDARPFLNGVWITTDNNKVLIVSTDGKKAIKYSLESLASDNLEIFIPQKLMSIITNLEKYSTDTITITKFDNVIRFETGNISVVYNPAENFNNVFKTAFKKRMEYSLENIFFDKTTTLSILNELKKEIYDCIDTDPHLKESRKNEVKKEIHIKWFDNIIKCDYKIDFGNVKSVIKTIPCVGNIKGAVKLNDLIHIINDIDSEIINFDVSGIGNMRNKTGNTEILLLIKRG